MEFYLAMAQQGLAGKSGSQFDTGDMSSLLSPNLGLLTGTLTDTSQSDNDIYASVAPNIFRVKNNPEADEIATSIVNDLESGLSLPQVIIKLRTKKSGEELKDYKEYATTISKEMGDFKSAIGKRKTPASEAGLPEPSAQYDSSSQMNNVVARLLQQAQPISAPVAPTNAKTDKKNEVGFLPLLKSLNPISLIKNIPIDSRLQYKDSNAKEKKAKTLEEERYAKANEARVKIAGQEAENIKSLLAGAMQRNSLAGSPFMDEMMKRTLMKKLIENPNLINKLKTPQG